MCMHSMNRWQCFWMERQAQREGEGKTLRINFICSFSSFSPSNSPPEKRVIRWKQRRRRWNIRNLVVYWIKVFIVIARKTGFSQHTLALVLFFQRLCNTEPWALLLHSDERSIFCLNFFFSRRNNEINIKRAKRRRRRRKRHQQKQEV